MKNGDNTKNRKPLKETFNLMIQDRYKYDANHQDLRDTLKEAVTNR